MVPPSVAEMPTLTQRCLPGASVSVPRQAPGKSWADAAGSETHIVWFADRRMHYVLFVDQTFFFGGIRHEIRWHKLFEIGFLPLFGDLKGLFRAEDENSVA